MLKDHVDDSIWQTSWKITEVLFSYSGAQLKSNLHFMIYDYQSNNNSFFSG